MRRRLKAVVLAIALLAPATAIVHAGIVGYHGSGVSAASAPTHGHWAWLTGRWHYGRNYRSNTHWWVKNIWDAHDRLHNLHLLAPYQPGWEVELYKPSGDNPTMCDVYAVVALRGDYPGIQGQVKDECGALPYPEQIDVVFVGGSARRVEYRDRVNFSIDFERVGAYPTPPPMEVNLSWEAPNNTMLETWLGKVTNCDYGVNGGFEDLGSDPNGIIDALGPCP